MNNSVIHGNKPKLLVLIGPTAVGKTRLSLELAQLYNCEIISGDSMQVYRRMDIGTAKASIEERQLVPHHMIDIHEPQYPFSVAEFQDKARGLIADIETRGKLPFIVGGTGLYVESVCYDFQFSDSGSDDAYREQLRTFAEEAGNEALHERLREIDPEAANRIHPHDQRRIIRALEIVHLSGITMSEQLAAQTRISPYDLCIIGLTMDRAKLYQRIEQRIDAMLEEGLLDEVRQLRLEGCERSHVSMHGLGYRELMSYLDGEYTWDEAIYLLKRNTRRFAKRQLSWFRRMKGIEWVEVTDDSNFSKHLQKISDIITGKFQSDREYNS